MAKLTRFTQLLFGSNAAANQIGKYGSLAAGSPVAYSGSTVTPALIQGLSNYLSGWFSAVIGNNSPAIEDLNAIAYLYSYQLAYLMQEGIPEYDGSTVYYTSSIVQYTGGLYQSLTDSNTGHLPSSGSPWGPLSFPLGAYIGGTNPGVTGALLSYNPTNNTIIANASNFQPTGSTSAYLGSFGDTLTLDAVSAAGLGRPLVVSAVPATHGLMVVRGVVSGVGSILSGEGFSVSSNGTGDFTITFSTAFGDIPAVTATLFSGIFNLLPMIVSSSSSSFRIQTASTAGSFSNQGFNFIAVGQRSA
jgi:hypothetical protein